MASKRKRNNIDLEKLMYSMKPFDTLESYVFDGLDRVRRVVTKKPRSRMEKIFFEQRGVCLYCDKRISLGQFSVDHIIPVSKGGSNRRENLAGVCKPCNLLKGGVVFDDLEKLNEIFAKLKKWGKV